MKKIKINKDGFLLFSEEEIVKSIIPFRLQQLESELKEIKKEIKRIKKIL